MPHPRRLRRAHLTDARQVRASRHVLGYQRPVLPERGLVADDGQQVADMLQAWSGPGFPDADTEARYRQAALIPGVAHCALESYRWAVRSLPRPDGLRYARRMAGPVTVPRCRSTVPSTGASSRPAPRAPAATSRGPTSGT